jgi:hypothetical protein
MPALLIRTSTVPKASTDSSKSFLMASGSDAKAREKIA